MPIIKAFIGAALSLVAVPAVAMFCSTDANLPISDGSGSTGAGAPASIDIVVPATFGGTVTDLNFDLQIDHTYVGDLIVTLTSPDGTIVELMNRPGSPTPLGIFGCSGNNINVTLDDEAGTTVESQCAGAVPTISGTHQPNGNLSDFDGDVYAGTWTLTVTDNAGQDTGTIISGGACINASTTPVTISAFKTHRRGKSLVAKWQTSSEIFNLGFHLWGKVDGEWQQLNKRLVASESSDSLVTQDYKRRVNLAKLKSEVTQVGLSAVSSSGEEEFYGPFEIGEKYGEEYVPRYIDWAEQRARYDQTMRDAGYVKVKQRWRKQTRSRARRTLRQEQRYPETILELKAKGVYRLSYEDLLGHGINLRGMPNHKLALTRDGMAVPRIIQSASHGKQRRFGPGSELVFYARGPSEDSARYVDSAHYKVSLNAEKALSAPDLSDEPLVYEAGDALQAQSHLKAVPFGEKNIYSFGLEGDGWYDTSIRAIHATASKIVELEVGSDVLLNEPANVSVSLLGVANFPQVDVDGDGVVEPNHHYRFYLNRAENPDPIHERYVDGRQQITINAALSDQLKVGSNLLEIEVIPDNGYDLDVVYFIDGELQYSVANTMQSASLALGSPSNQQTVAVLEQGVSVDAVYSSDDASNFSRRAFSREGDYVVTDSLANPSLRSTPTLNFVSNDGYLKPERVYRLSSIDPVELDLSDVDYVVIADSSLIGADLQRFVERQDELGRRTKVVSAQAVYQQYANGAVVPQAIADYLAEQAHTSPFTYVLLVGGHTYNYLGYNTTAEEQPLTLIPTFYRGTEGLTQQIPTAVPFVDFDHDGAPDRAIGRWPVRDLEQLAHVVNKTLEWHAEGSHRGDQTSLFIADAKEDQNNFTRTSERLMPFLGLNLNPWTNPNTVYLDDVIADESIAAGDKISAARNQIVDAVNQGPALTVFSGHAAPGLWGRQALVYGDVADRFDNNSKPSLMVPLACYTTYYETPSAKSLSEILLTETSAGAVALSGAALLSEAADNEHFGKALLKKMTVNGLDLGNAVMQVKRETHGYSARHQTIVYNWVTLGDPTVSFGLPNVQPPAVPNQPKKLP